MWEPSKAHNLSNEGTVKWKGETVIFVLWLLRRNSPKQISDKSMYYLFASGYKSLSRSP